MPVYDTYSSVRRLMETGIPEEQAVAIVREQFQFVESIATKVDVAALQADVESLHVRTQHDIQSLRADLLAEMKARDARLIQYITGLAIAMTGTIVTLLKVL